MDPQIVQNLRYKLQRRVRRLNSVNHTLFKSALRQFWAFFDANYTFVGIADLLSARHPDVTEIIDLILSGQGQVGNTEEESAAIGYGVLRRLTLDDKIHFSRFCIPYGKHGNYDESLEFVREIFLEPFYEYVDETLDDQRAMLSILFRYKHRCEWFHRQRLWDLSQDNSEKAERLLSLDLYSYLFDQGIDFTIEPSSITGQIDLIAAQDSDDPLLADAKIFDADSRSKLYLRKGFQQIYTYTQQHNKPFGYLIIFKITDIELRFLLSLQSRTVPVVVLNHKTIFLITIDIFQHPKPVSQRPPLRAVEITEQELITIDE